MSWVCPYFAPHTHDICIDPFRDVGIYLSCFTCTFSQTKDTSGRIHFPLPGIPYLFLHVAFQLLCSGPEVIPPAVGLTLWGNSGDAAKTVNLGDSAEWCIAYKLHHCSCSQKLARGAFKIDSKFWMTCRYFISHILVFSPDVIQYILSCTTAFSANGAQWLKLK